MGGARGFDREKDDFYPTPPELFAPLFSRDKRLLRSLAGVWEPACGDGAISRVLEDDGHLSVTSTDLVDRGYGKSRCDFLMEPKLLAPAIITNPPFRLWREFAEHAHQLGAPYIALLGRLQLLEGKRVSAFFQKSGLSRVMVSAGRVNMLPYVDGVRAEDKGHNGMIAWAWFVWLPLHKGPPAIEWFTPEKANRDA